MLPGMRNYTSPTSKTSPYWQQQVGDCEIILLPRICYQQILLIQCNYFRHQICLKMFHELIPIVCNKRFSLANHGHIYNFCLRFMLLYTCETWPLNVTDLSRLSIADNLMVRWIFSVKIWESYSMNELREKLKLEIEVSISIYNCVI